MKASLTLAFALLLICTGTALASTPDGTPPSGETVCDGESGAAYGLCTAYCEAMDCESDDPHASETACNKVGTKFQNITGRAVPCEVPAVACLCTSIPAFNAELEGMTECTVTPNSVYFGVNISSNSGIVYLGTPVHCRFDGPGGDSRLLTPEQGASCFELVLDTAASRGVTCATPE